MTSFWKYKVHADIRRGSSWRGRQIRVRLSTTAVFGELSSYFFGNFRDNIIWRYATSCRPVIELHLKTARQKTSSSTHCTTEALSDRRPHISIWNACRRRRRRNGASLLTTSTKHPVCYASNVRFGNKNAVRLSVRPASYLRC